MPDAPQDVSADERKALIAKITASRAFLGTEDLPKLLQFLFESGGKLLSAKDIEALHYRRPQATFNPNHARERISKLKDRLSQYETDNPEESVKCELPNADDVGGYQLRFRRLTEPVSACRRFWAAHLQSEKEVIAVCDPLLFFAEQEKMFRFMDTNIEGISRRAALQELERLHPEAHNESVIPGHLYVDVGSVAASDLIRDFFRSAGVNVPLLLDKQSNTLWLKASPVVIGNARNNAAVKSIFGSAAAESFAYRLGGERYATIHIKDANDAEATALENIGVRIGLDGVFERPSMEMNFGIVTRMPNPRGAGVMTFIASDGTFATKQMALALTDESQLRAVFTRMGWRLDRPVPASFEMMFLVRLWPGGIDEEGSEAKLLCGRSG
jgi:hypothetical protein